VNKRAIRVASEKVDCSDMLMLLVRGMDEARLNEADEAEGRGCCWVDDGYPGMILFGMMDGWVDSGLK
jgi:hypothetical protein